jgi:redox-sensitive bicupin YhaK (pirin superfamily)
MLQFIPGEERGRRDFGWLKTHYSFSFGDYYHPGKMGFGALRVLNEDLIAPSTGFATHPHQNMEIITVPLKGTLEHRDSMGHSAQLRAGEIQVMSAGTGIYHSERNPSGSEWLHLLQIWVIPDRQNVVPRYQQQTLPDYLPNAFFTFLGPPDGNTLFWIYQQAWFSLARLTPFGGASYSLHQPDNGVYVFVVEGSVCWGNLTLKAGDALALKEEAVLEVREEKGSGARILLMEVPFRW